MKISLNIKIKKEPYGGGNQLAANLKECLIGQGHSVITNLRDNDIDIILLIAPFSWLACSPYTYLDAAIYKIKHPDTVIIHRINSCDRARGTNYLNDFFIKANKFSDYTIFISDWLKNFLKKRGVDKKESWVIRNGADTKIFNQQNKQPWQKGSKMRIVTHHWSINYLKGHGIYQRLDKLLDKKEYSDKFEFYYIGRIPKNLKYKNTKIISLKNGKELAEELKKNHIYLTAARFEAAGMHHIEGACSGLPILFINSGALPEYCSKYGIMFNENNFEEKLIEMYENYETYFRKLKNYRFTAEKTNKKYLELFEKLKREQKSKRQKLLLVNILKIIWFNILKILDILNSKTLSITQNFFIKK